MSDPITITPEQAETLASDGLFVVDGRCSMCEAIGESCDACPLAKWVAADKPCPTCDGEGLVNVHFGGIEDHYHEVGDRCPNCLGTGRTVIELVTSNRAASNFSPDNRSLGLFRVSVTDNNDGTYAVIATKVET